MNDLGLESAYGLTLPCPKRCMCCLETGTHRHPQCHRHSDSWSLYNSSSCGTCPRMSDASRAGGTRRVRRCAGFGRLRATTRLHLHMYFGFCWQQTPYLPLWMERQSVRFALSRSASCMPSCTRHLARTESPAGQYAKCFAETPEGFLGPSSPTRRSAVLSHPARPLVKQSPTLSGNSVWPCR